MGRLSLMVLSLAVLPLAANSFPPAAVNEAQLQNMVPEILNRYRPSYWVGGQRKGPMFSLVVRIPSNRKTKTYDISLVPDAPNNVRNTIIGCEVYTGANILAATVLRWPNVVDQCPNGHVQWPISSRATTWAEAYQQNPLSFREGKAEHAEYRTLQKLSTWLSNRKIGQDLLLIYVYASPCANRCTDRNSVFNILSFLTDSVKFNMVFVFSKVFKPRNNEDTEDTQGALRNLGGTIGLGHIFRCDEVNRIMTCVNCSNNGNVAGWCYDDNQPPA